METIASIIEKARQLAKGESVKIGVNKYKAIKLPWGTKDHPCNICPVDCDYPSEVSFVCIALEQNFPALWILDYDNPLK